MKFTVIFFLFLMLAFFSCEKSEYAYKEFVGNSEIVYAGLAEKLIARSGNLRVQLEWGKSIDPAVVSYIAYWNNGRDSATIPATAIGSDGLYKYTISGIPEYVQSFRMVTVNNRGYRSIGQDMNGVRVFGPIYNATLSNQRLSKTKFFGTDSVRLYFFSSDKTKAQSQVLFYKRDNNLDSLLFNSDSVTLKSFKTGTKPTIQSFYLPSPEAIDTFKTLKADSLLVL